MTAALITGAGTIEFRAFASVAPSAGMVTVDIALCGICGTEIASYRHGHLHSPAVCGHEWTGVVSAVGPGVTDRREGDRVVIAVRPPCGGCPECVAGLAGRCRVALAMARGRDDLAPLHGGFAPRITVESTRVMDVHPGLSDVEAAQVEPATIALHGIRRSRITPGDTVVVQGGGPIGLLAAQFARAAGAGHVVVVEPTSTRRELALWLSADSAVPPGEAAAEHVRGLTGGLGADLVIECAGVPGLLQTAVDLARPAGTVTILSYLAQPASISPSQWLAKEITVIGAVAYTHDEFRRCMSFIADGRVQVAPLHTRTVGLTELGDALRLLATGDSADVKVLVDPRR